MCTADNLVLAVTALEKYDTYIQEINIRSVIVTY
jgi:hypothetical protein